MTDDDRKAKDVLAGGGDMDPETRANLERWFGLPSYEQVAEEAARAPGPAEDAELVARRAAQARAAAAVDPRIEAKLLARTTAAERMLRIPPLPPSVLEAELSVLDPVLLARADLAEPREVDLPVQLREAMSDPTPQALLRDLHRPELEFQLRLEVEEAFLEAHAPVDARAVVAEAMSRRRVPEMPVPPAARVTAEDLAPMRRARRERWADLRTPNRRVTE
jgi:hypothetical protein